MLARLNVRESAQQGIHRHSSFQARQWSTEAIVDAEAETQMVGRIARHIELIRIGKLALVAIG